MRTSIIFLSGLSAFAAAQSSSTDLGDVIQSEVSTALASASAAIASATTKLTPAEESSINSVAYSVATAAQVCSQSARETIHKTKY